MAAQQAMQQAIQINQQAAQQAQLDMQQASQQAQQDMQQAMQNAQQNSVPTIAVTRPPSFSVKTGVVAPGTSVRIKCATHYAVIYFTTNGWTPTNASRRYKGPIPISTPTQLQAIAIAPNTAQSLITRATYTVQGPETTVQPLSLSADGVLHAGTRLHLATNSTANSKTAQVGDNLGLVLDQDVRIGDAIVVPKGTRVDATITQADHSGHMGTPGDLAFEVHSLTVRGTEISLRGGETLEGENHYGTPKALFLIPVVGQASLLVHGEEAEIKPGMTFTATVAADTPLQP